MISSIFLSAAANAWIQIFFGGKKIMVKDKVRGMEQEWKQRSVATL
jgi:hypothetical protein